MNNQKSAEKTDFLAERIKQNEKRQTINLNSWAFGILENSLSNLNVLEFCCGTGRQTEYLAKEFPNSKFTCIDISNDAINSVKEASFYNEASMNVFTSGMDEFLANNNEKFDLVFVSYGLYYAKNIDLVINTTIDIINSGGRFVVLGPYGENNKQLFDLVLKSGGSIDDFVSFSSTNFMYDKVIRFSLGKFNDIQVNTIINPVKWESSDEVLTYWKNSTFYQKEIEVQFKENLAKHFNSNSYFENEKHIMLFQGINKR
ncbi:class I SAM-dependent methyltransferase [Aquirufa nivalisilvae]